MSTVKHYLSLVKFSHTIFALPFAIIGFVLALQSLHEPLAWPLVLQKLGLVLICMVTARSAAMAFNRYLDRSFDALNPRTAIREIPKGIISADHALRFVILNSIVFVVATAFINRICLYLSPVALFVILFYSYTKRFTALCHLVLGIGLALAPIGAYLAVNGAFAVLPLLFSGAVICWVSGFDIIYALQDDAFDKSQGLHSIPVALGRSNALLTSRLLHVVSAGFVIAAGWLGSFGLLYWIAAAIFIGMLVYQQSIVSANDLRKVNIAFMTANGIASVVFGILVVIELMRS